MECICILKAFQREQWQPAATQQWVEAAVVAI